MIKRAPERQKVLSLRHPVSILLASEVPLSANHDWPKLVARIARARDKEAFAIVFDYFVPRLEAYLRKLGLDASAAEEVSQDTMITLWNKADLFDPAKSSLPTWLYRVARNRRIDVQRRDRLDFYDPNEGSFTQIADDRPASDTLIDSQQREDRTRVALKTLPEEQGQLVNLAFYQGLSHSEIAQETGLPLGTVKSRIRLAFTRLRRALEADGITEAQ